MVSSQKYLNKSQLEPMVNNGVEKQNEKQSRKTSRIFLTTIAANISTIAIGTCLAWSSPVGPKLTSKDSSDSPLNRPLSANENAWISSIFTIGALITPFVSGPWANKIGRKRVLLFSSIFFILGYTLLLIASDVWVLIVGRLTLGFGAGFVMSVIPVYVGEISTDGTRGATVSLMPFLMIFGACYVYCIGPFVSYSMLQFFCLLVPTTFVIVFIFMPESPYYSIANGHRTAASKALQFLRGQDNEMVETEMLLIETTINNSMGEKVGISDIVKTSSSRKALLITLGLLFFQQICGLNVVIFYTQTIFESAHINLEAPIAAIIIGFVQLISSGVAPFVVQQFRRKLLLLYSAAFMGISLAALGIFFFSQIELESTSGITWLPLAALVLYNVAYGLGFGPVPWAVLNEIFPSNTKSHAAALSTSVACLTGFVVALIFPTLVTLGTHYAFWLFDIFCVLAFLFVLFVVVETKNQSFTLIQNKLNRNFLINPI